MTSLRAAGIDAGGRATLDGVACGTAVVLTRLVIGSLLGSALLASLLASALFSSMTRGSDGWGSPTRAAASTGRGRGNGLAGAEAAAGILVTVPNIGDGW